MSRIVGRRATVKPGRLLSGALLIAVTIVILLPVFFMISSSLKTNGQIGADPIGLPWIPQWSNYVDVFGKIDYLRDLFNTVFIAAVSVVLVIVAASAVSWVILRWVRRWTNITYQVIVAGLTIPMFVLTTPLYLLMRDLRLLDTYWSAILIYAAINLPFATVFYVSFLRSIPEELEDAAVIDGAGPFRTYWYVILPLAKPATATIAIFVVLSIWNDVVVPLIFLSSDDLKTVTLSVLSFVGTQGQVSAAELFPAVVLATLPLLIIFVILQRWIIAGITAGVGRN